jgi:vacuolar-type H+-ATPase subunit H
MEKIIIIFTLFFLQQTVVHAQFTGGSALLVLNSLESKAENLISDFEGGANDIINNASLNILNAIREFKEAYESSLNKTEKVLDRQTEKIFKELRSTINLTFSNIENSISQVDNSINNLGLVISQIPLTDKTPRITKLQIPIVVNEVSEKPIISFGGILLNNKRNYLKINEKVISSRQMSDRLIDFPIVLYLHKKRKAKAHKFILRVIPQKIAEVTIVYDIKWTETKRHNRKNKTSVKTSGPGLSSGRKRKSKDVVIHATKGMSIDIHSVKIDKDVSSGCCGDCKDKFRVSHSSINAKIKVKSDSHPGGRSGKCTCTYEYEEIQKISKTATKTISNQLLYNSSLTIPLPNETSSIKYITIKYCDGTQRTITDFYSTNYPLFNFSYSSNSKVIVLTPKLR